MTQAPAEAAAGPDDDPRIFSTTDPDQAHDYICRTYMETTVRMVGDQSPLRMRDDRYDGGLFTVEDFTYTAGLQQLTPPVGRLMVARVLAGRWQRDTIGEARRMTRGDVCLVTQPDRPHLAQWDTAVRLQIISLDPSLLLDVAAAPGDLVPRFTALTPGAGGSRRISAAMDDLATSTTESAATPREPLGRRTLARTLAATLLETFPNTAARGPVVHDRIDAGRSRVLRTAVAYLHDHAHTDVTVGHLAEAAGASRQAVHLAFRQHLQTTPQAYLGRLRLDRAHRDLVDFDPATTTVAQVAELWGFVPLERFRRDYVGVYGCTPESTLAD